MTHDAAFRRHVVATLKEHIEPTAKPEPLSWRTQFDRNRDYVDRYDASTGSEVSNLWNWMLRGLKRR
ncbi:MAG: hypothetical protein IRY99_27670 [Isosphaeraceae bacterium]|nr:hypothetical protein [Isosphaeraceae bacterium]